MKFGSLDLAVNLTGSFQEPVKLTVSFGSLVTAAERVNRLHCPLEGCNAPRKMGTNTIRGYEHVWNAEIGTVFKSYRRCSGKQYWEPFIPVGKKLEAGCSATALLKFVFTITYVHLNYVLG